MTSSKIKTQNFKFNKYFKTDIMMIREPPNKGKIYFKDKIISNNFYSADFKDFIQYIQQPSIQFNKELYEVIPNQPPQGIPIYFDIEWESYNLKNIDPLTDFLNLFAYYCNENHGHVFNFNMDNIKSYFSITCATRKKEENGKSFYKHSYHLILRKINIHFKDQIILRKFLKDFDNYVFLSINDKIIEKRQNLTICKVSNDRKDKLPDTSVYCSSALGKTNEMNCKLMRCIWSSKGTCDSVLRDIETKYPIEDYLVSYVNDSSKLFTPTLDYSKSTDIINKNRGVYTKIYLSQTEGEIPNHIVIYAKAVYQENHPQGRFLKSEIHGDTYKFFFEDGSNNCLCCNRPHTLRPNNFYTHIIIYHTTDNSYIYICRNCETEGLKISRRNDEIERWNYDYRKETLSGRVNCLPIQDDYISKGGTFLLQAPKGTGKTEAIIGLINQIDKNASVLVPSYRINICSKTHQELEDYGFSYYKDKDFNPHRAVVCLNSLHLCIPQKKYDYIIIDEVYSVLESFSATLMKDKKQYIMKIFEKFLTEAGKVYCLDAHLNCGLVVKPLHALRNPDKFVYHRNPNLHDYSDYTVYYDEYNKKDDNSYQNQIHSLLNDLKNDKKIAIMSSSKNQSIEIFDMIKQHQKLGNLKDFQVKLYNSETDGKQKADDFRDTNKSWGSGLVKAIIYSPTVSAGISYNDTSTNGVHSLYCFVMGGDNLPSFNTTRQMFFRVRQLLDKKIFVCLYKQCPSSQVKNCEIESKLKKDLTMFNNVVSLPFLRNFGFDEDFNPTFETDDWSYKLWFETKSEEYNYNSVKKLKLGIYKEFCNKPFDADYAGRGMKFVDKTMIKEDIDKELCLIDNEGVLENIKLFKLMEKTEQFTDILRIEKNDFNKLSSRIKKGSNPLDEIELYQYQRYINCSKLDIDLELIQNNRLIGHPPQFIRDTEYYSALEFVINIKPQNTYNYNLQKTFLNANSVDCLRWRAKRDILKYFTETTLRDKVVSQHAKETLGELWSKDFTKPQIIDELVSKNYHKLTAIYNLFNELNIKTFSPLENELVNIKQLQPQNINLDTLKEISNQIQGSFKEEKSYINALLILNKFYKDYPNKCFWFEDRDELLKEYKFYDKFIEFSPESFRKRMKVLNTDAKRQNFKNEVITNSWCPTAWRTFRVELWKDKDIARILKKSVEYIGYKMESNGDPKAKRKINEYRFINIFEALKPIQMTGIYHSQEEKEAREARGYYKEITFEEDEEPKEDINNPLDDGVDLR